MSREIEFRGIRLDKLGKGKWAYGALLTMKHAKMNPMIMENSTGATYEVYPETVGQFTGLHDRNKVKIFEGDIVKCYYPHEIKDMEVIFNQVTCSFEFKDEEVYDALVEGSDAYEVIGDIYSNPELLSREAA